MIVWWQGDDIRSLGAPGRLFRGKAKPALPGGEGRGCAPSHDGVMMRIDHFPAKAHSTIRLMNSSSSRRTLLRRRYRNMGFKPLIVESTEARPMRCCNFPQQLWSFQAAESGGRRNALPALKVPGKAIAAGPGGPAREYAHVQSHSVRRDPVYRLQAV